MSASELKGIAHDLRFDIVKMIGEAGSGHPGGSLSCADIMTALYFGGVLKHDPQNPKAADRDRFVLAKGHAAPALYAALAHAGYFPVEELITLRKLGSRLQGHPDSSLVPGVEVSTGSLGQGLSISCGLAAGLKINNDDHAVIALLGDGECQEGQVWEAAMFAAHNKLDNLIAIVDLNGLQIDGKIEDVCSPYPIDKKFEAFNFNVINIDGHDFDQIRAAMKAARDCKGMPTAIIMKTTKGKGVSFMENNAGWHGKAPNDEEYATAMADLAAIDEQLKEGN